MRFFLRVAATMVSKRFVKLDIQCTIKIGRKQEVKMTLITSSLCQKIGNKDDSYNFKFIAYPSFKKGLEKRETAIKNIQENFSETHFRSGRLSKSRISLNKLKAVQLEMSIDLRQSYLITIQHDSKFSMTAFAPIQCQSQ